MVEPLKDPDREHPVATALRDVISSIVAAIAADDFDSLGQIAGVLDVEEATRQQIRDYVSEYGETLVPLPEESWSTSVAQWHGPHWELLVDLYTAESGASDLVLGLRVRETAAQPEIEIGIVYVP